MEKQAIAFICYGLFFSLHYLYMLLWILDDIFTRTGVIMNPAKRKGYRHMGYLWLGAALAGGICMYLVYVLMKPEEF